MATTIYKGEMRGAAAAANAGVNDRLFNCHGRWRSDKAKGSYVKNNLDVLRSVSKSLESFSFFWFLYFSFFILTIEAIV